MTFQAVQIINNKNTNVNKKYSRYENNLNLFFPLPNVEINEVVTK